jgi:uncharacterized membrane protein YphA (DoxX/SURF4 family)
MKLLIGILRWFVGILFIFSGLIKANDPVGLSYKMQEFFEIWGWHALNDYTLFFSITMIAFEIIAGVAVIIGWQFRLFSMLLFLLIVFFTFLTGYAVFSGKVRECGCFGDCIKLTAMESFIKDIILFIMISILLVKKNQVKSWLKPVKATAALLATTVLSIWVQMYVLDHLPIIDCLPFKVGNNINEGMQIPPGSTPDSTVINFVYQHNGKEVEFDAEHFPADFNDSAYTFLRRYDKLIREGNAKPPIKDFVIIAPSGTDTTQAILNDDKDQLILFARTLVTGEDEWVAEIRKIAKVLGTQGFFVVTSDAENMQEILKKNGIGLPVMKGDLVSIKTAARTNPTLFHLRQGQILAKYGRKDIGKFLTRINDLEGSGKIE